LLNTPYSSDQQDSTLSFVMIAQFVMIAIRYDRQNRPFSLK